MIIKAGIYGASGYSGMEMIKLLNAHPDMEIGFAASDSFAGEKYENVTFSPVNEVNPTEVQAVFLCTPHGASAPLAARALDAGAKVVDLSADLRLNTPQAYEHWYGHPHPLPELLPAPYGLPEFNRDAIRNKEYVSNPGCYPTCSLLALSPLAQAGAIKKKAPLIIDAKSGVSGAGRKPSLGTHFVEIFGDFKPYNLGRKHRHVGEIEQELYAINPELGSIIFSPHLIPIDRGLLATCYVPLAEGWTIDKAREIFETTYANEPLVKLLPDGEMTRISDVARTNSAILSLHEATPDTLIVVSAIDNLLKGASSQAVQNANLMFDLPETAGLVATTG